MANAGINGDRHKVARQSAAAPDTSPKKVMVKEQSFVSGLSVYLSGLHADRIERSAKGEDCKINSSFDRNRLACDARSFCVSRARKVTR